MKSQLSWLLTALVIAYLLYAHWRDQAPSDVVVPALHIHDRYGTQPVDQFREFEAFVSSFDGADDDTGDGIPDTLGIPQWVAYQITRYEGDIESSKRPRSWATDAALYQAGLAPKDETYRYSRDFRSAHRNFYVRGHLAMKYHAERLGHAAAKETHTLLNAVPQRQQFNNGIWLDLECLTGAWANQYGAVWIVTGPVFYEREPKAWIGEREKGERLAAVPDALFKVVIKDSGDPQRPDVLAFIYPQEDGAYGRGPYPHERFIVSIDQVETLTQLNILSQLNDIDEAAIQAGRPTQLWPVAHSSFAAGCK